MTTTSASTRRRISARAQELALAAGLDLPAHRIIEAAEGEAKVTAKKPITKLARSRYSVACGAPTCDRMIPTSASTLALRYCEAHTNVPAQRERDRRRKRRAQAAKRRIAEKARARRKGRKAKNNKGKARPALHCQ